MKNSGIIYVVCMAESGIGSGKRGNSFLLKRGENGLMVMAQKF